MISFLVRRLGFLVFILLGVSFILFAIIYWLPGDPARTAAGPAATPQQLARIRHKLGLDKPVYIQYLIYVKNLVHGDLGESIRTRKPVTTELANYLPASLELVAAAMLIVLLIGVPLGVLSALKPGRLVDTISRLSVALGMGMPAFWVALIFQLIFFGKLHLLPFGGQFSIDLMPPSRITGFGIIDALLTGNFKLFTDGIIHLIGPAIVLALPDLAVTSRLTRSSMLEVLRQDYITTARAKGLPERIVIMRHALKNAALVPLTMAGMQVGFLLGNTVLVESIFSWGGIGWLAVNAVYKRDFPIVIGITLVICLVFVLTNTIVDILYTYLDPRIRY